MIAKQDRVQARTPAQLEQKYDFGKNLNAENSKLAIQVQQLNQNLSQFMVDTRTELDSLDEAVKATYNVIFYGENNIVIAGYAIAQGDAINPPVAEAMWIDSNGVEVIFPYTPTSDTNLYIVNEESTL